MDLLITVSNAASGDILNPLLKACVRRGCSWQVFLTHEGVKVLHSDEIVALLQLDDGNAVVCHDSWQKNGFADDCPVTLGSQTNHSEMAGLAARVVSL